MRITLTLIGIGILTLISACIPSFNFTGGGGQDPNLKTIAIPAFPNEAPLVVPTLSVTFTEELQDIFLTRSRLDLIDGLADVTLSGSITNYTISPVAITDGVTAAQNRLTITVKVNYENGVNPSDSWEKSFSSFVDFAATENFSSREQEFIEEVVTQLTQDIFNESIGKW
ncbi:MAG: LptE family protein [Bacteroidota bacterium]